MRVLEPRSRESWNRDRWHRAWPAIDGTVRGPRSMAPCVATARDSGLFFDDLHGTNRHKRCRRESHGSGVFPVWRFPVTVGRGVSGVVRGRAVRGVRGRAIDGKRRCALALRRSVRGAIAVSDRSNVALRGLCCDFGQNSSEPRCGRSLRPIVFSTLVSYRAGRCLRT